MLASPPTAALLTRFLTPGGRGPMSTAGKVLVVLVMLASLVWIDLVRRCLSAQYQRKQAAPRS